MKITKEEVLYTAELANLKVSEADTDKLTLDFSKIIEFVSQLNELDTEGVEPDLYAHKNENVFRSDEVEKSPERDELLKNAPCRFEGYFEVPKVVE